MQGVVGIVLSVCAGVAGAQTPTRSHTLAHYQMGSTTLYVSVVWFHTIVGLSVEAVDSSRSVDILFSADQANEWADTTDRRLAQTHAVAQDAHVSTEGPTFADLNDATIKASSDESEAGKTISLRFATARDSTVMTAEITPAQLSALTNSLHDAATAAVAMTDPGVSPAVADQAFAPHSNRRRLVYFEFNVEHPARRADKHAKPVYPETLREAGLRGSVRLQFIVDTSGKADTATIKVLSSSDPEMTRAARDFLVKAVYTPAMIKDRPVAQLVEENYDFEP